MEDFEQKPATKRDLADVKEELGKRIGGVETNLASVKAELKGDIARLEKKIDDGFENMEQLLGGPKGLITRVKRVEEAVGLSDTL